MFSIIIQKLVLSSSTDNFGFFQTLIPSSETNIIPNTNDIMNIKRNFLQIMILFKLIPMKTNLKN